MNIHFNFDSTQDPYIQVCSRLNKKDVLDFPGKKYVLSDAVDYVERVFGKCKTKIHVCIEGEDYLDTIDMSNINVHEITFEDAQTAFQNYFAQGPHPYLKSLGCLEIKVKSLAAFPNLVKLCISCTKVTEIDLSLVPRIKKLDVSQNRLKSLVLSCVNLKTLNCAGNNISKLDLSRVNLKQLNCTGNVITKLDLTKQTRLKFLNCANNQIKSLEIPDTNLELLMVDYNPLKEFAFLGISKRIFLNYGVRRVFIPRYEISKKAKTSSAGFSSNMSIGIDDDYNVEEANEELLGVFQKTDKYLSKLIKISFFHPIGTSKIVSSTLPLPLSEEILPEVSEWKAIYS